MPAIGEPTEAEMRAEWEANGGHRWRGNDRVKLEAVVLPRADVNGVTSEEEMSAIFAKRAEADDTVAKRLKADPARFAELARSIVGARFTPAGDWQSRGGMHGLVDRVAFDRSLKIGDVIGPVMGPARQTIYRIADRRFREEVTFEDVRDRIGASLTTSARPRGRQRRRSRICARGQWVDADCSSIGPVCPVGCHVAVHRTEKPRIVALLARSPSLCHMMCTDGIALRCIERRCVERR